MTQQSSGWSDPVIYAWIVFLGVVTWTVLSAAIGKISGRGTPIKERARRFDEKMEHFFTEDLTAFLQKAFVVLVIAGLIGLMVGIGTGSA